MRRFKWLLVPVVLLLSQSASAIQLQWNSGSASLSFETATRCTLVIQADSTEGRLPAEWRLLWAADSSSLAFVSEDPWEACLLDEAQVSSVEGPATVADSASNLSTAHFCSAGSGWAMTALQVLDLPAGGRGRLKVVALDPSDPESSRVIVSNEVAYNGGVEGGYPPVVLHASSIHNSLQLRVTAVGAGLLAADSLSITALDSSWTLPLTVIDRGDRSLTGVARVAALLPACQATIGSESGAVSAASLPADEGPESLDLGNCGQFTEELLFPPPPQQPHTIQPKDFAFARGFVDESSHRYMLHLFYIRHNYWYDVPPRQDDLNEKNIGHIWTDDFNAWYGPCDSLITNCDFTPCMQDEPDTCALTYRPGEFDELHVWAPSIVKRGPFFHMFYTGVRDEGGHKNQRIGVAKSTDLNSWTPAEDLALTSPDVPWASKDPVDYGHSQQLRDPFVIEYPANSDQWLMYFVAVDSLRAPKMAVGVAKSSDLVNWQALPDPFSSTERATVQGETNVVESPHVFQRNGQWWLLYTVNNDQVFFETTTSADPADTVAADWTDPVRLRNVVEGFPAELQYWHATEYLRINSTEYLVAWDDSVGSIDVKGVFAPANPAVDSMLLACPEIAGIANRNEPGDGVRMALSRLRWGVPEVGLRLVLPSRMPIRLAVFDIAGRRRASLVDGELPAGMTEVTWNGRDASGARVASGMYFIRLTCAGGARVTKVVLLR